MPFKPPHNPDKMKHVNFRRFDGIGGPQDQILKRYDPRQGYDISNTIVNDLQDITLGKYGQMRLRAGNRKIYATGELEDIDSMFLVNIGNRKRYAVKHGNNLDIIDIPIRHSPDQAPLDFTPPEYRAWTVQEVMDAYTVTTLLVHTVSSLLLTRTDVAKVYPIAYPGDPL